MTKEKKATSKKTSKAKSVKVNEDQFDLIIDFGPAHEAVEQKEKEIEVEIAYRDVMDNNHLENEAMVEDDKAPVIKKNPWYKRLGKAIKDWFNR